MALVGAKQQTVTVNKQRARVHVDEILSNAYTLPQYVYTHTYTHVHGHFAHSIGIRASLSSRARRSVVNEMKTPGPR